MYGINIKTTEVSYTVTILAGDSNNVGVLLSILQAAPNVLRYSVTRLDGEFLDEQNELGIDMSKFTKWD